MTKIIFSGEGKVPGTILAKFEALILLNYQKRNPYDSEIFEDDNVRYRLKFELFIEPTFLLVKVLHYEVL